MGLLFSAILCQEELFLENGEIIFYNSPYVFPFTGLTTAPYHLYTYAIYTCNDGFALNGANTRWCGNGNGRDGEWTDVAPTCQRKLIANYVLTLVYSVFVIIAILCQELSPIFNGDIEYNGDVDGVAPFNFSTTAMYTCDEGYALVGDSERNCTGSGVNGTWDGFTPTCECKYYN